MKFESNKFGRKKFWLRIAAFIPGILIFIFISIITRNQFENVIGKQQAKDVVIEDRDSLNIAAIYSGAISKNSSLYSELLSLELPRTIVSGITTRFSRLFNLSGSQPGDSFQVMIGEGDTLLAFEYITNDWRHYRIERDGDEFKEIIKHADSEKSIRVASGKVTSTLWDAVVPLLPDESVFADMVDIFGWEIDFMTETQTGDAFKIIYEVYQRNGKFVKAGKILAAEYTLGGVPYQAYLYQDSSGHRDYYNEKGYSLRKALLKSPLNYRKISSRFSYARRHPIYRTIRPHLGVDYAAAAGTPVVSPGDGAVTYRGWKGGFGRYIEIRHSFGLVTTYGHLSSFAKGLSVGSRVSQGQVIGFVGSTGDATGPHLDYRVKRHGVYIDPLKMTLPAALPVREEYRADFYKFISEYSIYLIEPPQDVFLARAN